MASNKKINVPIRSMSSDEIYVLLDTIESDDEEDISLSTSCLDIENHLNDPNTPTPIEAVVGISQPDSDSDDDVPLNSLQVPKADKEWEWRKQFKRAYVDKCVFAEDGIVNIDV